MGALLLQGMKFPISGKFITYFDGSGNNTTEDYLLDMSGIDIKIMMKQAWGIYSFAFFLI